MGIVRDMQSKLATLILGILSEEERGPYEITKMLENLKTKKWLPMADSTVYAVINGLRKKGLIEGRKEKENMSSKNRLQIFLLKRARLLRNLISGFF